jgi:hypothetical protein
MYNVLLTSRYVRISELGIQWCVLGGRPALDSSASDMQRLSSTHGWSSSLPCAPVHDAFCSTKVGESALTLFSTSRVHMSLAQNVFVDSKLDFVLDVDRAIFYWRRDDKPSWWSLCVTLSSLFFFTRVCEHLALLVRDEHRPFSQFTIADIISMLLLCRCLLATGVLSQHLVTREELMLNLILDFSTSSTVISTFLLSSQLQTHSLLPVSDFGRSAH